MTRTSVHKEIQHVRRIEKNHLQQILMGANLELGCWLLQPVRSLQVIVPLAQGQW